MTFRRSKTDSNSVKKWDFHSLLAALRPTQAILRLKEVVIIIECLENFEILEGENNITSSYEDSQNSKEIMILVKNFERIFKSFSMWI